MKKNKKVTLFLLAIFFFVFLPYSSQSKTLLVPQQYTTITSAIKASVDGDTIQVSPGTYYENLYIRKNIDIVSTSGAANTIIDGGGKDTVIHFASANFNGIRAPKISGFTIRNGSSSEGKGGGVTIIDSDSIVENCNIISNSSSMDAGGVLIHQSSDAVIRNNFIDSNSAQRYGGGIFVVNYSNPLIYNNHISNNTATGPTYVGGGAGGGGIAVDDNSSPRIIGNTITSNHGDHVGGGISLRVNNKSIIEDNTITQNNAAFGGGIHIETESGGPTIRNNVISNNQANQSGLFAGSGHGGGISVFNKSTPQLVGNTISGNFATVGGGGIVCSENANMTVTGNKIYSNTVTTSLGTYTGGGIYVADSSATINNNVIYKNEARIGGGIGLVSNANANIQNNTIVNNIAHLVGLGGGVSVESGVAAATLHNNIITLNSQYQVYEDQKKANITSNLINNNGSGIYFNSSSGAITNIGTLNGSAQVAADSNVSGNEAFVDAASDNYDIQSSSVAVNSGGSSLSIYDKEYRFRPFGSGVDIGAYEYSTDSTATSPIYRFWSDVNHKHFYTIEQNERNLALNTYHVKEWQYEGQTFRAYKTSNCSGGSIVYRFWSNLNKGHFYTISEAEKQLVMDSYSDDEWFYEGPAYCAKASASGFTVNLHRFWSKLNRSHFYTADEGEKTYVQNTYAPNEWFYEGLGYYVYPNN